MCSSRMQPCHQQHLSFRKHPLTSSTRCWLSLHFKLLLLRSQAYQCTVICNYSLFPDFIARGFLPSAPSCTTCMAREVQGKPCYHLPEHVTESKPAVIFNTANLKSNRAEPHHSWEGLKTTGCWEAFLQHGFEHKAHLCNKQPDTTTMGSLLLADGMQMMWAL